MSVYYLFLFCLFCRFPIKPFHHYIIKTFLIFPLYFFYSTCVGFFMARVSIFFFCLVSFAALQQMCWLLHGSSVGILCFICLFYRISKIRLDVGPSSDQRALLLSFPCFLPLSCFICRNKEALRHQTVSAMTII